jgi:hypothetical protein
MTTDVFHHSGYTIRRKVLTVFGAKFHVFSDDGELLFFTQQKAFKLKEDIRLYASEAMSQEMLVLRARSVIDFGVTFDVFDPVAGEVVGSIRRKGLRSMLRDEWLLFDAQNQEVAVVREDGSAMAILRRLHPIMQVIAPQAHHIEVGGLPIARFQGNRNPFVQRTQVTMLDEAGTALDPRLSVAAAILITAIEGRQQ